MWLPNMRLVQNQRHTSQTCVNKNMTFENALFSFTIHSLISTKKFFF